MTSLTLQEFASIFELCQFVMSNSQNSMLLLTTLTCLEQFLDWIPTAYIIEYELIPTLCLQVRDCIVVKWLRYSSKMVTL